jgi:hypothetical protein
MKRFNKLVTAAVLFAMMGSMATIEAQDFYESNIGGIGYEESRQAHSFAPAIALGTVAAVAIIAVAVQNRGHHGHAHAH